MDKLHAIRAFIEVASAGGFSKAARNMGLATSSLTRLLDALEESLCTALLTRTTRQVTLTDAGTTYLEQVSKILADLTQADESVADNRSEPIGNLRVSVPVTFGRLRLSPFFANFLQAYPRITLDIVVSDAYCDLAKDHIDVAIRIGAPENDPNLIVRRFAINQRFVVASKDYLNHIGTPTHPHDLTSHECVRFNYGSGRQYWNFQKKTRKVQVEIKGRLLANSLDTLHEATRKGAGVALLPEWLVSDEISAGTIIRLFEDWKISPQAEEAYVYAAYLQNRRFSRKTSVFIEQIEHYLKENVRNA
ncbi:LysR family transcriptional regulator [Undibacterium sp. Jales W-56]|uniref:LysR family transcriptional regulator n=1 Tax=Undibacterium sp. Jales W-56 TaxID=2897325 RepID=UPI0021D214F3|nr:LysR family transcriptional regulator [Undibacterium sp. Jales W-56]MCU6432761.1 LysR family transcriptional regulator [Undibacterium sp. Jales W-56]